MKILLTVFEPFGGDMINSTQEVAKQIHIDGAEIIKINVPVVFNKAGDVVYKTIIEEKPDVVLCLGQAEGRAEITPEVVAINLQEARIADNEGNKPSAIKCIEQGENAYFSSLPIRKIVENIKKENIPVRLSYTAGTYVCNDLMYSVLYHIESEFPNLIGGFIHLPILDEQVKGRDIPSISLKDATRGIEIAIKTIIDTKLEH